MEGAPPQLLSSLPNAWSYEQPTDWKSPLLLFEKMKEAQQQYETKGGMVARANETEEERERCRAGN